VKFEKWCRDFLLRYYSIRSVSGIKLAFSSSWWAAVCCSESLDWSSGREMMVVAASGEGLGWWTGSSCCLVLDSGNLGQ